jgi:hypothetical protein
MVELLGLVLIAFVVTAFLIVPFIDFLFFLKRKYEKHTIAHKFGSETPIHDKLMKDDETTPSGGGVLLIAVLTVLTVVYAYFVPLIDLKSLVIPLFTLLSFGALGFVDDVKWLMTKRSGKVQGLKRPTIIFFQTLFAIIAAFMLYSLAGINNLYIPGIDNFIIGWWYIPLYPFFALLAGYSTKIFVRERKNILTWVVLCFVLSVIKLVPYFMPDNFTESVKYVQKIRGTENVYTLGDDLDAFNMINNFGFKKAKNDSKIEEQSIIITEVSLDNRPEYVLGKIFDYTQSRGRKVYVYFYRPR